MIAFSNPMMMNNVLINSSASAPPTLADTVGNFSDQFAIGAVSGACGDHVEVDDEFAGPSKEFLLVLTTLWGLISLVGVTANLYVIAVVCCGGKLQSATQYFIINLSVSDLLFLLTCPTLALINLNGLIDYNRMPTLLAKIICKFDYFSTHLSVFITCLTLMSMTFDRYLMVMHPLKALTYRSKSKAIFINMIIWIISILLSIPHGYYRVVEVIDENASYCINSPVLEETTVNLFGVVRISLDLFNLSYTIVISYVIPVSTIVVCYMIMIVKLRKEKPMFNETARGTRTFDTSKRRRILIMIALVTILFAFSWLPLYCFLFAMKLIDCFPYGNSSLFTLKTLTHTFTYLNSMLNPFLYTIMGESFRKQVFAQKNRFKAFYRRTTMAPTNPLIASNGTPLVHAGGAIAHHLDARAMRKHAIVHYTDAECGDLDRPNFIR